MSFLSGITDQLKQDILNGVHQPGDTYKIALYTQAAATTLNSSLAAYTATGELVTGSGYTRDSKVLTGFTVGIVAGTAYMDFGDPSWTGASFTADAALIYNSSRSNAAMAVLAFASTTAISQTFTINMPAAGAAAVITIS